MYDKRTLESAMLRNNVIEWLENLNPGIDATSLIDTKQRPREFLRELKKHHPEIIIDKPSQQDFLSVNNYGDFIRRADLRWLGTECLYCGKQLTGKRSTRKYCSTSHRYMAWRKRKSNVKRVSQ